MDIIAIWLSKVSKTVEISSSEESRTWKAVLKTGEFAMKVWVDFSKISLQHGEETRTFNFDSYLRGVPNEDDSSIKKARTLSQNFFSILMACLVHLEVLEDKNFKAYLRRVLRTWTDEYEFLCESLINIETGLDIVVSRDQGIGMIPLGTILVIFNGGSLTISDHRTTRSMMSSSENIFCFLHWVLKDTKPLGGMQMENYWENLSPSVNPYSARYRSRFELATSGLARMGNPSFKIPELRPRGFKLEMNISEVMHVVTCFAVAEFRIKASGVNDGKQTLFIW